MDRPGSDSDSTRARLRRASRDPRTLAGAFAFTLLAMAPALTGWLGEPFYLDLATRILILAIAAASLNLILGYGGMISFGHSAYLGIGAYAVGIPAYYGEYSAAFQLPLALGASALFAFVTGLVSLRTRGVYFIMITLAFAQMIYFAFVSIEEYGGDDGLVIDLRSETGGIADLESGAQLYYAALTSLVLVTYLVRRIVRSRFGLVLRGSRDNDARMQALGFNTFRYRLACYVLAGMIAGLAGWLLGNFTNFISPEMMDWTRSGELIFMVVLGGGGQRPRSALRRRRVHPPRGIPVRVQHLLAARVRTDPHPRGALLPGGARRAARPGREDHEIDRPVESLESRARTVLHRSRRVALSDGGLERAAVRQRIRPFGPVGLLELRGPG